MGYQIGHLISWWPRTVILFEFIWNCYQITNVATAWNFFFVNLKYYLWFDNVSHDQKAFSQSFQKDLEEGYILIQKAKVLIQRFSLSPVCVYSYTTLHWFMLAWVNKRIIIMKSSNGNIFRVTGPLCREFTGHWWVPRTKASDAELWCFLWSAPE